VLCGTLYCSMPAFQSNLRAFYVFAMTPGEQPDYKLLYK
jgi:hypothetical protein